jgi:phosphomannomutase
MITASHNAPRYNGIKLKAAYGGSATPEQCRRVEVYITDNESRARGPNLMDYDRARIEGLINRFNPSPDYEAHLRRLIDFDLIAKHPQQVVVDSMHGSGRGLIRKMLQGTGCEVFEVRGEMNLASAVHPGRLRATGGPGGHRFRPRPSGLATDGDGDRIGRWTAGNSSIPASWPWSAIHRRRRGWRGQ